MLRKMASLCLLAVVVALATTTAGPAYGDGDSPLPALDLSLESSPEHPNAAGIYWTVTVHNNQTPGHPPTPAHNVVVRMTVTVNGQELTGTTYPWQPHIITSGTFDASAGLWTIPFIPPSGTALMTLGALQDFLPGGSYAQATPFRLYAELVEPGISGEAPPSPANNQTEAWYVREDPSTKWPISELGVQARVTNRRPMPGAQTTFEVAANRFRFPTSVFPVASTSQGQWDVQIKIELSPGLSFSPTLKAPAGRPFDPATGIWEVGHISGKSPALSVPVNVTTEDIPLERRCLTATIVNVLPAFALDGEKQNNDVTTVCLGDDPPVVASEGELPLFWLHDCTGANPGIPCHTGDKLKIFARADHNDVVLPGVQRRDEFGSGTGLGKTYLDSESVIVQVRDPDGRWVDDDANSVNTGDSVSWRTGGSNAKGVAIAEALEDFGTGYKVFSTTLTLTGVAGGTAPGKVNVRLDDASGFAFFELDTDPVTAKLDVPPGDHGYYDNEAIFYEFENLGTYALNYNATLTLTDNSEVTADADYIFHVGPISELGVRDGGPSPLAGPGQRAYTILAANNGPDRAPAVEVALTGVPRGAEAIAADGTYREGPCNAGGICEGRWDLGDMPLSSPRFARGETPFPTLTLISRADAAPAEIQATIANTEDYSVTIDGDVHSTNYFDYVAENDSAAIAARPGTGAGALRFRDTLTIANPPAALVRWDPVELLNRREVSHYEVHESAPPCRRPAFDATATATVKGEMYLDMAPPLGDDACYAVRAVNEWGVKGYWATPGPVAGGPQQPQPPQPGGPATVYVHWDTDFMEQVNADHGNPRYIRVSLHWEREGATRPVLMSQIASRDGQISDYPFFYLSGDDALSNQTYCWYIRYDWPGGAARSKYQCARIDEGDNNLTGTTAIGVIGAGGGAAHTLGDERTSLRVSENAAGGTFLGTAFTIGDAEGGSVTWSLEGDDRRAFHISNEAGSAGELTVASGGSLDYESRSSYSFAVRASDGTDSHSMAVTVNVTDVDEPPSAPAAPTVTAASAASLTVAWTAPANAGPPIEGYDVRYREGASGGWTDFDHTGAATSATISGLNAETAYEAQVRARNAEGEGPWSDSGAGSTPANGAPESTPGGYVLGPGSSPVRVNAKWPGGEAISVTLQVENNLPSYDPGSVEPGAGGSYTVDAWGGNPRAMTFSHPNHADDIVVRWSYDPEHDDANPPTPTVGYELRPDSPGEEVSWQWPDGAAVSVTLRVVEELPSYDPDSVDPGAGASYTVDPWGVNPRHITFVHPNHEEAIVVRWSVSEQDEQDQGAGSAPEIAGSDTVTLSVAENAASGAGVGAAFSATDADGDTVTWSLEGVDKALFAIDSNGQVSTAAVFDHEDSASRSVTVKASDGVLSDTVSVTVNVTDVNEPPPAPAAPMVTAASSTSLTAAWTVPDTTGRPAVTGYRVRYSSDGGASWSDAGHSGTATTMTIDGLAEETEYQVQVQAVNDEGDGGWSASGTATTEAEAEDTDNANPPTRRVILSEGDEKRVNLWWPHGPSIFVLLTTTDGLPSYDEDTIDPGDGQYEVEPFGANPRRITFSHPDHPDQVVEWRVE